jgi:ferritin-like metal-binding protein YciE
MGPETRRRRSSKEKEMALFRTELNSLQDLLANQVEDLYDAEQRLIEALPKMAEAAHSPQLKQAFQTHLEETRGHVGRLEQVFEALGQAPKRETCQAMKGLIAEGEEAIKAKGDPAVQDAALIAAAQRVEHYEMAGYGTARTLANQLGHERAASVLQDTLEEEKAADRLLTEIAESSVNRQARASAGATNR